MRISGGGFLGKGSRCGGYFGSDHQLWTCHTFPGGHCPSLGDLHCPERDTGAGSVTSAREWGAGRDVGRGWDGGIPGDEGREGDEERERGKGTSLPSVPGAAAAAVTPTDAGPPHNGISGGTWPAQTMPRTPRGSRGPGGARAVSPLPRGAHRPLCAGAGTCWSHLSGGARNRQIYRPQSVRAARPARREGSHGAA